MESKENRKSGGENYDELDPTSNMSKDYYNDVDKDIQIENIAKSISEDDKLATKAKLNNALRKNFHKKSILLGPILLVVLVGIIVQYIYTNYYVLPLKERSLFEPLNKLEIDRKLWGQYNPQSIFLLRTCHPNSLQFGISWYDNTAEVTELRHYISDIESFQTLIGDGKSFGHHVVLDKFGNVTIHWVSIDEYWSARISVNRDPFHYGTTIGLILHLYSGNANSCFQILTANNFDELFEVKATAFKEKFENVFGLKEMGMPDIYQAMGMTALSNLLSSVSYYYGNLGAIGYYNSSSIDDHLFSLLTLSHFDIDIIKQIIRSWLGIMNKLGVLPTELQQETLDFRISQAPTIFYLINKLFTEEEYFVNESFGYNSLYPMMLKLLPVNSLQLNNILEKLEDSKVRFN
uniref:Mannosyl-oligosaccharide glucosidase n=1 Tax=Heterorhabditis bacteriophora TaxID=37862 RepID=A0A1I7X995_HETBA